MKMMMIAAACAATLTAAPVLAHDGCGSSATAQTTGAQAAGFQTVRHATPRRVSSSDIVGVAASAGQFATLLAAADAAGLVPTLRGPGPFTVFAPTDAAFAKLPGGTVETLLRPENRAELARILSYHVVAGRITSDQLVGRTTSAATVAGPSVQVDGRTGVRVNGSTVIQADVAASNGVIHVIDTVLLPPAPRRH